MYRHRSGYYHEKSDYLWREDSLRDRVEAPSTFKDQGYYQRSLISCGVRIC